MRDGRGPEPCSGMHSCFIRSSRNSLCTFECLTVCVEDSSAGYTTRIPTGSRWSHSLVDHAGRCKVAGEAAHCTHCAGSHAPATATTVWAATVADVLCSAFSNSRVIASNLTGGFALSKRIYDSSLAIASPMCKYRTISFPSQSQSMALVSEESSPKESVTTGRA